MYGEDEVGKLSVRNLRHGYKCLGRCMYVGKEDAMWEREWPEELSSSGVVGLVSSVSCGETIEGWQCGGRVGRSAHCNELLGGGSGGMEGPKRRRWLRQAGKLRERYKDGEVGGSSSGHIACLGQSRICVSAKNLWNRIKIGSGRDGWVLCVAEGRDMGPWDVWMVLLLNWNRPWRRARCGGRISRRRNRRKRRGRAVRVPECSWEGGWVVGRRCSVGPLCGQ